MTKILCFKAHVGPALVAGFLASVLAAGQSPGKPRDLAQSDLVDLMNTDVTSVSKKEQKLSRVPAAVFVISQEDIRRSGATNIPDLLRLAPGVNVAQVNASNWAISIRGFNNLYVDKVLVLVDGRSVYREVNSGVHWEEMDVPLEDIDRIEVIRGPGGTAWGANAVNGVINIITKHSRDSQGGLISGGGGSATTAAGFAEYGGRAGSGGTWRGFAKYFNIGNLAAATGGRAADGWHGFHEGFRSDWELSSRDQLMVEGDLLQTEGGETVIGLVPFNSLPLVTTFRDRLRDTGAYVLGRWNHTLSNGSTMSLQLYDDYYTRRAQGSLETENRFDLDFEHHVAVGSRNDVVWGLGARVSGSDFVPGYNIAFLPRHRVDPLGSVFVQDEIRITDFLAFTVGSKFEHNSYTGFEYEPGAQLTYEVTRHQTLWASAARAIRQPSRRDYGILVDLAIFPLTRGGFGVLQLTGTPHPQAEQLRDFEVGHRAQISKRLSLDSVAFLSIYRHLSSLEPQTPYFTLTEGPPHLVLPLAFDYKAHAHNYGAEVFANWMVTNRWEISPGYSWLHLNALENRSGLGQPAEAPGLSPRHQLQFRSSLNLTRHIDWNTTLGYTGRLTSVPGYTRVDTSVSWRPGEFVEFGIVGQNLIRPRHEEFTGEYNVAHSEIERSVFGKITWRF